jgi:hypothetical protein
MTGLELAFVICAAIGGVLFLSRFVMQLFGLHHDVSLDIHSGDLDLTNSDVGFKALSFQSITAFLLMFGLVGFALQRSEHAGAMLSLGGATAAGLLAGWVIALLFRGMSRLQSSANYDPRQAIGQRGSVYLTIPAGGTGKVTVTINNRLSVLDAVAQDKSEMKTGVAVQVVDVVAQNILMVSRV